MEVFVIFNPLDSLSCEVVEFESDVSLVRLDVWLAKVRLAIEKGINSGLVALVVKLFDEFSNGVAEDILTGIVIIATAIIASTSVDLAARDRPNTSDGLLIVPKIRHALIHKRMD